MDIGSFLSSLREDYKTTIVSLLIIFPMAYADCWKFSESFKSLDMTPQLMLAAAVATCLAIGGLICNMILNDLYRQFKLDLHMVPIVIPTGTCTISTLLGFIWNITQFWVIWLGIYMISFGFHTLMSRRRKKYSGECKTETERTK